MPTTSIICASILPWVILVYLMQRWKGMRQIQQLKRNRNCEDITVISSKSWFWGLDVAKKIKALYDSGERNHDHQTLFENHGHTFQTKSFDRTRIFTVDPENLKVVFGGSPDVWGVAPVRFDAFEPFVGGGVLITDGLQWRHERSQAQDIIDRLFRRYSADLSLFDWNIDNLIDRLPIDGSTIDLQPLFYAYTMDSSTANIFGQGINALKEGIEGDYGRNFVDAFVYCLKMAGERDEAPHWSNFMVNAKFRDACRMLHQYADSSIYQLLHGQESAYGKKEGLGNLATLDWARSITDHRVARDQILNVMAANFDTVAILLTNTFFHLARNTQCYSKLRNEVRNFVGQPDSQSIKSCRYLQMVLNETLRLNGPASFNSRVALQDSIIPQGGGLHQSSPAFVSKGTLVIVNIFALQRKSDVYGEDANSFRPERWESIKPKHWEYMPFSAGPRTCPGQKFALMHAAYVLFRLVREIESMRNQDPVFEFIEEYRVATGSKNGAKVSLIRS